MKSSASVHILVCANEPASASEVRAILERAGYQTGWQALEGDEENPVDGFQLVVIDGGRNQTTALQCCRRLRARLSDAVLPILYLTEDHSPQTRLASLEAGADTYLLRPFAPKELLAQIQAFIRTKDMHDRLMEKTSEVQHVNKRLQQAHQQINEELELARCVQMSFLPQTLPAVAQAAFAVRYMLCGRVGGDFYDAFRLDENHVGFYVADAMGHGVPASLLTIFVKKGVRAKEVLGQQYRLPPPAEVLQRLNRELIDQSLSGHPFITMVYALYNHRDRVLQFARAGHPYPLYVPKDGEPRYCQAPGSLLGVFEADFSTQTQQLKPGDKFLLYSDGVEGARFEGRASGADSLTACAARHQHLPIEDFIERLAYDLFSDNARPDDLTLLGLEART